MHAMLNPLARHVSDAELGTIMIGFRAAAASPISSAAVARGLDLACAQEHSMGRGTICFPALDARRRRVTARGTAGQSFALASAV